MRKVGVYTKQNPCGGVDDVADLTRCRQPLNSVRLVVCYSKCVFVVSTKKKMRLIRPGTLINLTLIPS